jgi:hypothetical protein
MFAAGVGLGASKGAEIGKHPEGYAGYLSKGKDMVRRRRMGAGRTALICGWRRHGRGTGRLTEKSWSRSLAQDWTRVGIESVTVLLLY